MNSGGRRRHTNKRRRKQKQCTTDTCSLNEWPPSKVDPAEFGQEYNPDRPGMGRSENATYASVLRYERYIGRVVIPRLELFEKNTKTKKTTTAATAAVNQTTDLLINDDHFPLIVFHTKSHTIASRSVCTLIHQIETYFENYREIQFPIDLVVDLRNIRHVSVNAITNLAYHFLRCTTPDGKCRAEHLFRRVCLITSRRLSSYLRIDALVPFRSRGVKFRVFHTDKEVDGFMRSTHDWAEQRSGSVSVSDRKYHPPERKAAVVSSKKDLDSLKAILAKVKLG